jgi:hypothetical protein
MSKVKDKKVPLVIVEWGDAHGGSRWVQYSDLDRLHAPIKVRNVGYLVKEDNIGVTLTHGFDENNNLVGTFFIPKNGVIKITKVKY